MDYLPRVNVAVESFFTRFPDRDETLSLPDETRIAMIRPLIYEFHQYAIGRLTKDEDEYRFVHRLASSFTKLDLELYKHKFDSVLTSYKIKIPLVGNCLYDFYSFCDRTHIKIRWLEQAILIASS
jgi:hypothetical protein